MRAGALPIEVRAQAGLGTCQHVVYSVKEVRQHVWVRESVGLPVSGGAEALPSADLGVVAVV